MSSKREREENDEVIEIDEDVIEPVSKRVKMENLLLRVERLEAELLEESEKRRLRNKQLAEYLQELTGKTGLNFEKVDSKINLIIKKINKMIEGLSNDNYIYNGHSRLSKFVNLIHKKY